MNHEITEILKSAGYPVVEGAENVKRMIRCASDGSEEKRCSGYRVFPDGTKCEGCSDCKPNVPLTRGGTPSRPASGSGMLLDCEGCWTHSIPIEDCDGDNCPLCGSSMLMEQGDQFDASVWGGGHNRTYVPNKECV